MTSGRIHRSVVGHLNLEGVSMSMPSSIGEDCLKHSHSEGVTTIIVVSL